MKRTLVGVGLLVAAGVGTVAMAPGGGAQEGGIDYEVLESEIVPNPADPGESVTFSSVDPCTFKEVDDPEDLTAAPGDVVIYKLDDQGAILEELTTLDMEEDGSWSYEFDAPSETGEHFYGAECRNEIYQEELDKCGDLDGEENFDVERVAYRSANVPLWFVDCTLQIYVNSLTVGDEVPPTTPPTTAPASETPPPATPVVTPPDFTG